MALQNLGSLVLPVGSLPQTIDGFRYNPNLAYALQLQVKSERPDDVFSFLRVRPVITQRGVQSYYYHRYFDFDILTTPFRFLLPFCRLYLPIGFVSFEIERRSYISYGGDFGDIKLELSYENRLTQRTWLR